MYSKRNTSITIGKTYRRWKDWKVRFCSRIRILRLAVIFVLAIMGGFSLILLIVGSLATGATRHQVYTGFRSRLGGRIATGFVSFQHTKKREQKMIRVYSLVLYHRLWAVAYLDIYNVNISRSMHWFIYSKISLYWSMVNTNRIELAKYSFTSFMFNTWHVWYSCSTSQTRCTSLPTKIQWIMHTGKFHDLFYLDRLILFENSRPNILHDI